MSDEYRAVMDYVNDIKDYNFYNGIKLTEMRDNYAECRVMLTKDSFNQQGYVHGGLLFSICDVATGFAVSGNSKQCVTSGANISYLKAVGMEHKYIRAVGIPVRVGRHTASIEGSVYDDEGNLVAKGTFIYCFLN